MGDDTWVTLFDNIFDEQYPLDSFNTFDLDTVDNEVADILFNRYLSSNQSNNRPFDFLLAHVLGVDHVGHSYSPNSP